MEDLKALNKRILSQVCAPNGNVHHALNLVSVCLGTLKPNGVELAQAIGQLPLSIENTIDLIAINKEYLNFARQVARDITNGNFDGLVVLSIDLLQARVLARLTNQQITDLSRYWPGTIFRTTNVVTLRVNALHAAAVPHYSAAILAA